MQSPSTTRNVGRVAGRMVLGLVVGASFGIAIGALIASWVYGVGAIEEDKVAASYLAAAVTIFGALAGAAIGFRASRDRGGPES